MQIRKIKRKLIFNQSESRIKDLHLIFLICVQKRTFYATGPLVKTQFAFDFSDLRSNANFMQRGPWSPKVILMIIHVPVNCPQ